MSLLPHISKVFERIMDEKFNIDTQDKLSKRITGFRKTTYWKNGNVV